MTGVTGPCAELLGRPPEQVVGLELAAAVGAGVAEGAALAALFPGGCLFVRGGPADAPRWLRVERVPAETGKRFWVLDLEGVLSGAPPLQIARIASSLSHELRNPLSSIKLAVQTLAKNPQLSERDQRRLTIAHREVRTMERMLALLSEYGRDLPPKLEPLSLRAVVLEALSTVEPELQERSVQGQVPDEDGTWPKVRADANRLRAVLAQLFLNVAAGCPEGGELAIRFEMGPAALSLSVTDPTAELPDDEREVVFEPFGTFLARSAGLSLAALHRVMRALGGDAQAEPARPGTTYRLSFPV